MFLLICVSVLVILNNVPVTVSSACSLIGQVSFPFQECRTSNHDSIQVAGHRIQRGTENVRIRLGKPSRKITIICKQFDKIYSWASSMKDGNQLRVSYYSEYYVRVQVYWCDNFDGPKKASIHCAVEAFSTACPGKVGDHHICVYKVQTRSFSSDTVRNAVEVSTEVAAEIRRKVQVSVGVSYTHERVRVRTYTVERVSYIFIPAGYRFCSFSEVHSVEDYQSATGFSWRCKLPTYVQSTVVNGRCTDLSLCDDRSPCPASTTSPSNGAKSTAVQPLAILLLLLYVTLGST